MARIKGQPPKIEYARIPIGSLESLQLGDVGENESGRFRGLAVRFNSPVETFPERTLFREGAFARTISQRGGRVKILFGHDMRKVPIGIPTELKESKDGLIVAASLNKSVEASNVAEMLRHLKSKDKLEAAELSIGFDAINFEMFEDPETREIFRVVTEARLWEISVVAFGADPTTEVREAASMTTIQLSPNATTTVLDGNGNTITFPKDTPTPSHADGGTSGRLDTEGINEALDAILAAYVVDKDGNIKPDETQKKHLITDDELEKVRGALKALRALVRSIDAKSNDKAKAKQDADDAAMRESLAVAAALAEIELAEAELAREIN